MDTKTKKPRVAKAPKQFPVAVVRLFEGEAKALYRLMDKGGMVAAHKKALFTKALLEKAGHGVRSTDTIVIDTSNIFMPFVTLLRDEEVKPKAPRKPRAAKAADGATPAPAARKPRTPKA
jgi:hypothetical protein